DHRPGHDRRPRPGVGRGSTRDGRRPPGTQRWGHRPDGTTRGADPAGGIM
ncbi:uncharacterized protein METZ01_LOCUS506456, partial [marine metagenome]